MNTAALAAATVPAPGPIPGAARPKRPNILSVQGCAGCGQPERVKVQTPHGVRRWHNRLKLTVVPNVYATVQEHPRRAPVARQYPVFAKLCKGCRKTAQASAGMDLSEFEAPRKVSDAVLVERA